MDLVTRTQRGQRALLGALLAGAAILFWRGTYDVFNTFKATLIIAGTICIVLLGAYRASRTRRVHLPRSPVVLAAAVLAACFVVATVVSPTPMASVVGRFGRHTGLAMYLTYLVLFVVTTRLYADHSPAALVKTLLAAAVPVTAYGVLQAVGVDPYPWRTVEGGPPVFSTFGNANFFAAFLGLVVPLATWGAVTRTWSTAWRAGSGALAVAAFAGAYASNSQQGPGVAVLGAAFVVAVALVSSRALSRGVKGGLLGGGTLLSLAAAVLLAVGAGPFGGLRAGLAASIATRTPKWRAALDIWREEGPVFGVGLERFADYFFQYRPNEEAARRGLERSTDTPHDIPLDMLVNGGVVLAVAYLAFVGLTGWALVVGLRRNTGEDRLLLAGLGGAWLAYQLQSLVSIDVPPVAVLHYVLAGAIVALGTRPALREILLPGAKPASPAASAPAAGKGKTRKGPARPPRVPLVPNNPVVVGLLVLLGLGALVVVTTPVRADTHAADAQLLSVSDPEAGLAEYQRASEIAFWEPRYAALQGALLSSEPLNRPEDALAAHLEAAERDPRGLSHALNVARLSAALGRPDEAADWWGRVLTIDPKTPDVLAEAGRFRLAQGDVTGAAELVQRAVDLRGDKADFWVALGEVRRAEQNVDAARTAFQRALELDPAAQAAADALAELDGVAA